MRYTDLMESKELPVVKDFSFNLENIIKQALEKIKKFPHDDKLTVINQMQVLLTLQTKNLEIKKKI